MTRLALAAAALLFALPAQAEDCQLMHERIVYLAHIKAPTAAETAQLVQARDTYLTAGCQPGIVWTSGVRVMDRKILEQITHPVGVESARR